MTDAEYKKQRNRIRPLIEKWKSMLRLNHLNLDITWDRSYSTHPPRQSATTMMDRWKYLSFEITFYLPACSDSNDEELEALVVHELVHCLLAPISMNMKGCDDDYQVDLMELNTSHVERALLGVQEDTREAGK